MFANIYIHKRMNKFTLRTKWKVNVRWRLLTMVCDIGKIHIFKARLSPNQGK
ncbi:MAG: hypothetical protein ACOYXO_09470 [Chloroflexota bacterium]